MADKQDWEKQLESGLRRTEEAIAHRSRGKAPPSRRCSPRRAEALEHVNEKRKRREEERRASAEERRRRRRELEAPARPTATSSRWPRWRMLAHGGREPHLWWLLFVSFGFSMAAASILTKAALS